MAESVTTLGTVPKQTLVEHAAALRAQADEMDRRIAKELRADLAVMAARALAVKPHLGIPDRERSELIQIGVLIERGLQAIEATEAKS